MVWSVFKKGQLISFRGTDRGWGCLFKKGGLTYLGVVVCDNAAASFNTRRALEMSPTRDGRREGTNVSTDATGAIDTWTVCASISSLPSWMNYTSGGLQSNKVPNEHPQHNHKPTDTYNNQ